MQTLAYSEPHTREKNDHRSLTISRTGGELGEGNWPPNCYVPNVVDSNHLSLFTRELYMSLMKCRQFTV